MGEGKGYTKKRSEATHLFFWRQKIGISSPAQRQRHNMVLARQRGAWRVRRGGGKRKGGLHFAKTKE